MMTTRLENYLTCISLVLIPHHSNRWININKRMQFKILSLAYKVFQANRPLCLCNHLTIKLVSSITRSSCSIRLRIASAARLHLNDLFSY
jgi:hypothetical protein